MILITTILKILTMQSQLYVGKVRPLHIDTTQLANYQFTNNEEHNRLLVSLFHAMGLEETTAFGGTDLGNGALSFG